MENGCQRWCVQPNRQVDRIELWFWELKDELSGKWRRTRYRMTEENARRIDGTLEIRQPDPARIWPPQG